ncbi:hypothetical protein GQ600_23408 [Phytophthora cactorum]|nr:hypothetical protein GQ600_23408 [Phytophthora cactorum]
MQRFYHHLLPHSCQRVPHSHKSISNRDICTTEAEIICQQSASDDEIFEDKPSFTTGTAAVESPRRSFLSRIRSRKSKSPASVHSEDDGSNNDSQVEAGERTLLRQLSPRLSFLPRKSKRPSSRVSDSEESKIDSSVVPEPQHLGDCQRAQPPSSATTPLSEPPPVATNVEAEDRTVYPEASHRVQFDFLSDTRSYLLIRSISSFRVTVANLLMRRPQRCKVQNPRKGESQAAEVHGLHHRHRYTGELTWRGLKLFSRQQIAANSTFQQTSKVRNEYKSRFDKGRM